MSLEPSIFFDEVNQRLNVQIEREGFVHHHRRMDHAINLKAEFGATGGVLSGHPGKANIFF